MPKCATRCLFTEHRKEKNLRYANGDFREDLDGEDLYDEGLFDENLKDENLPPAHISSI